MKIIMETLSQPQCQKLLIAWKNFETTIGQLPMSDVSALLAFHCRNVLEKLATSPVERSYLELITKRINTLVNTSPVKLDIGDVLKELNKALADG